MWVNCKVLLQLCEQKLKLPGQNETENGGKRLKDKMTFFN